MTLQGGQPTRWTGVVRTSALGAQFQLPSRTTVRLDSTIGKLIGLSSKKPGAARIRNVGVPRKSQLSSPHPSITTARRGFSLGAQVGRPINRLGAANTRASVVQKQHK